MSSFQDLGGAKYELRATDAFSTVFKRLRAEFVSTQKAFAEMEGTLASIAAAARQVNQAANAEKAVAAAQKQTAAVKELHESIKKRAIDEKKAADDAAAADKKRIDDFAKQVRAQQQADAARARIFRANDAADAQRARAQQTNTRQTQQSQAQEARALQQRFQAARQEFIQEQRAGDERIRNFNTLRKAQEAAGRAQSGIFGDSIEKGNKLLFTFRRLVGVLAVFTLARELASGISAAVTNAISLNAQLEQTQTAITGTIAQLGNFRDAQGNIVQGQQAIDLASEESRRQLDLLRLDAVRIGTTFGQLAENFQIALGQGIPAGLKLDEIRRFTVLVSQAAQKVGVAQNQLAEEIRALVIPGAATARSSRIFTTFGFSRDQIENARAQNRLAELFEKRLGVLSTVGDQAGKTFTRAKAQLQAFVEILLTQASTPFFDSVKKVLLDVSALLLKVNTNAAGVIVGFTPNPKIVGALQDIFNFLSAGVERAGAFIRTLNFDTVQKDVRGVIAVLQIVEDVIFAIARALGTIAGSAGTLVDIFGPVLKVLSPVLGVLIQIRATFLLMILTAKGFGGIFNGFLASALLAKAGISQLRQQFFGLKIQADSAAAAAARAASASAGAGLGASTGILAGARVLGTRILSVLGPIALGVSVALTAIDVVKSFLDSNPVDKQAEEQKKALEEVEATSTRVAQEQKLAAEEAAAKIADTFKKGLEAQILTRASGGAANIATATKEVLDAEEARLKAIIDKGHAALLDDLNTGFTKPLTPGGFFVPNPPKNNADNVAALAAAAEAEKRLKQIQELRKDKAFEPKPLEVDQATRFETANAKRKADIAVDEAETQQRIAAIKKQQLPTDLESLRIAEEELALQERSANTQRIIRKLELDLLTQQTEADRNGAQGDVQKEVANTKLKTLKEEQLAASKKETTEIANQKQKIEELQQTISGSIGLGIERGLRDLGFQMSQAFVAGKQLITTAVQQTASFISDTIADAFDPSTNTTFRERFANFLQGLSRSIFQTLTNLGIGALLAEIFPTEQKKGPDVAADTSAAKLTAAGATLSESMTTGASTASGTLTLAGESVKTAMLAGAAAVEAAAIKLAAASTGSTVGSAASGAAAGAWTGGVIGLAGGGRVPRRGRASPQHYGFGRPKGLHPSDRIPIWAALGEFMEPVRTVTAYGADLFEAFRRGEVDVRAARALIDGNSFAPKVVRARSTRMTGMATGGGVGFAPTGSRAGSNSQQLVVLPVLVSDKQNVDRFINSDGGKQAMLQQAQTQSTVNNIISASRRG